jgi:hypothetical protein
MKLGSGILKHSIQDSKDDNFHSYNSLILRDDLAFQRMYFKKIPTSIPCLYQHDIAPDYQADLHLQNRSNEQSNALLKIAILIASNACKEEISQVIIDFGASCCVTPYIEDFINQQHQYKTLP